MESGGKVQTLRQQFENYEKTDEFSKVPSASRNKGENPELGKLKEERSRLSKVIQSESRKEKGFVEDTRRNGIYVSNCLSLHSGIHFPQSQAEISTQQKRRAMVLDLSHVPSDDFVADEEPLGSADKCSGGDDVSVTSSSSSTCIALLNPSNFANHNGDAYAKDVEESQAHTPTSSSGSSGSGYGKVKRSNAFRAKDISSPTNDLRFVHKPKLVLERVKSLDSANAKGFQKDFSAKSDSNGSSATSTLLRKGRASSFVNSSVSRNGSSCNNARAVNVVTPYQVSDIYSQKSELEPLKCHEAVYAVPIHSETKGNTLAEGHFPPKIPPPPQTNPPSAFAADQIGLPMSESNYAFMIRNRSQYGEVLPSAASGNMQSHKQSRFGKEKNPSSLPGPPEKPPRTFLYDILSDRQSAVKNPKVMSSSNNNSGLQRSNKSGDVVAGTTTSVIPDTSISSNDNKANTNSASNKNQINPRRQYSSSSSSSTLTSSTTSYKQPQSGRSNVAVATATVRQTNKSASNFRSGNKLGGSGFSNPSSGKVATGQSSSRNNPATIADSKKLSVLDLASQLQQTAVRPPLVRSKTESQLILKNKSGCSRNGEEISSEHLHYDYGYKVSSASNGSHIPSHVSNGPKIYDTPAYSSTKSLIHQRNRYPSSPGIYQAVSSSKDYDSGINALGLPLSSNARYSQRLLTHHHHHPSTNFDNRSSSLVYMTGIDVRGKSQSPNTQQTSASVYGSNKTNSSNVNTHHFSNADGRIRDRERSKSEWALNDVSQKNSDPSACVMHIPKSSSSTSNHSHTRSSDNPSISKNSVCHSSAVNEHPSLESSSSSNTSNQQIISSNKRHGLQQSIQNLVNQLFSASTAMKDATSSTDSGIQLGSESLSSCDTPIGDSTTDTGDSDCENDPETSNSVRQVVEARKGYVRRVSSIRVQELGASINCLIQSTKQAPVAEPLFECLLVVGLNRDPYTGVYHAYIRDKFPSNVKLPSGVEQFCFPDSLEWPCHEGLSAQFYTLAITDQRGARKYGCCYRILPEGANMCIPITYCLISSHRAIGFYKEILREITIRHGYAEYQKRFWMEELYKKPFPLTGGNITVSEPPIEELYQSAHHQHAMAHDLTSLNNRYGSFNNSPPKTVTIKRRADHRLDEGDLVTLLTTIEVNTVIKIFGSLLLERKVVLISRALSTLSLCVEALESMLYPFSWQHTFVPILPLSMTDVLDAPAPYLIGVLKSSQDPWDRTLDEGIVVDLDQNKIISCIGDEGTILPKRICRKLRDALQLVLNLADQKDSTKNVLISECFIRMFVETMGHHDNHIVIQQDGLKIFEKESFVKSSDSKATQNFLEWFSETSMFHEFTQIKLKNTRKHGLFEQRIMEQYEQNQNQNVSTSHGTPLSLKNAKLLMNRTKPFGNWLKETFVK